MDSSNNLSVDPEFGELRRLEDGVALRLPVECAPWGPQTLEVSSIKTADCPEEPQLDTHTRQLIRFILKEWECIWEQAAAAWLEADPDMAEIKGPSPWELEAGIAQELWAEESGTADPWQPGSAVWQLVISANAGASGIQLVMAGSEVIDIS